MAEGQKAVKKGTKKKQKSKWWSEGDLSSFARVLSSNVSRP